MDKAELKLIIEALLLSADRPLSVDALSRLLTEGEKLDKGGIREIVAELQEEAKDRVYRIHELASGYRLQVKQDYAKWVLKLWEEKPPKYSRATLETLAIIVYKQPVTRAEIEDIRGVAVSSHIMRSLLDREWIKVVGHRDVPGKPGLYATTKEFLDYFNLQKLDDLPELAELTDFDQLTEQLSDQLPLEAGNDQHETKPHQVEIDFDQCADVDSDQAIENNDASEDAARTENGEAATDAAGSSRESPEPVLTHE